MVNPGSNLRRWRVPVVAALLLAGSGVAWWHLPPDPVRVLRAHSSRLLRVERVPAPRLGTGVERWRMISARGDTATALWRAAATGTAEPWTVVLLGGLQTGDRAALLLPDGPLNVLAVDWPWSGPRVMGAWQILVKVPAIQRAVLSAPGVLARGVEAVARQPDADPQRIALVGASLGVPPALAALRITDTPRAVVLLDGAADIGDVMRAGLEREGIPRPLAKTAAALAFRLIRPLEPALHARAAARLPVLLVNARRDRLVPRSSVLRLHSSLPHAEIRWRPDTHLRPHRGVVIEALTWEGLAWLRALPPGRHGS